MQVDHDSSDADDFSGDECYNPGLDADLQSIGNGTIKYLNYTTNYVRDWKLQEAFRETYQNWRDGMLRSFAVVPSAFRTKTEEDEKKRVILIKAFAENNDMLLGFIRFQYDKSGYCVGGLKIANFKATLPFRSLGTGATSKASDSQQTGQYGEGMKLSALVVLRNQYNFRIESGGFKWNFIFKKGELACSLRRIKPDTLKKLKLKEQGKPRSDVSRAWEDVCVIIGAPGDVRMINGTKVKADRLHIDSFRKMLEVTLDINPPKKMISTPRGDLIRDPNYQGKMYLRGLLLPSGGMSDKGYVYGYNFVDGSTTRDRDTLVGSGQESKRIAAIWASAIQADSSDDSDLLTEYTNLILHSLNQKGDAILSRKENCLKGNIAKKIWNKMRTMYRNQQGHPAFYYSAIEGKDEVHIIEQSLNNNPVPLDLEMWNMLRKFRLCRTPGEELLHRFEIAKAVDVPSHSFAMHVDKMLRCLLQSFPATKDMGVAFVDGQTLRMNAAFSGSAWRIHNRWLTYAGAHGNVYCDESAPSDQKPFLCDHVVLQLWDIMISQLIANGNHPSVTEEEGWLKSMARARLSQMPRAVQCKTTATRGELQVQWESVDSHRNKDKEVKIVLHSSTCTAESAPRARSGVDARLISDRNRMCSCPSQFSKAVSNGVTFENLDASLSYVPSVFRNSPEAFIALHPTSIKPLGNDLSITPSPENESRISASVDNALPTASIEDRDSSGYGESMRQPDHSEDEDEDSEGADVARRGRLYSICTISSEPCRSPRISNGADASIGPSSRTSSRVPIAAAPIAAAPTATPPRKVTHDQGVQTDIESQTNGELYVLGGQIEHRALDWGGTFPGSHVFHRARNASDQDIFILKPKQSSDTDKRGKRKAVDDLPVPEARRRQFQAYVRTESEELSERAFALPRRSKSPTGARSEAPLHGQAGS